jgi:asparagine synthase (glutamine-hydrolysing)
LPARVSRAPKRGFEVPVAKWLEGDLRPMVDDLVRTPSSRLSSWGDHQAIDALVSRRTPFAGNWGQSVWGLLMLELFLRGRPLGMAGPR